MRLWKTVAGEIGIRQRVTYMLVFQQSRAVQAGFHVGGALVLLERQQNRQALLELDRLIPHAFIQRQGLMKAVCTAVNFCGFRQQLRIQ